MPGSHSTGQQNEKNFIHAGRDPAINRNCFTFFDIKIDALKVPDTGTFEGLLTYGLGKGFRGGAHS